MNSVFFCFIPFTKIYFGFFCNKFTFFLLDNMFGCMLTFRNLAYKRIVLELTEVMQVSSLCYMFDCLTLFMMFVIVGE